MEIAIPFSFLALMNTPKNKPLGWNTSQRRCFPPFHNQIEGGRMGNSLAMAGAKKKAPSVG